MVKRGRSEPLPLKRVRCAIYTRKSTVEGLDQDFNSLDAQREAAEAYVASQKHEGWVALDERYDDGGYSGGTLERPALKRLLNDVECGLVDCIVIYKIDRLSRAILDFSRIVEVLDRHEVSFVSVKEQFSTTTPTGRLHLHMILSFAQYEREVIAERIRDKIGAAKRKGKHTGGMPVLGYDTDRESKRLVVNPEEAKLVVSIFKRFRVLRSPTTLAQELNRKGHRTKSWTTLKGKVHGGRPWNKAHIYRLLNNRKYIGEVEHKGTAYPGEQEAIVTRRLWDDVHGILTENHRARANGTRAKTPALLKGIIRCGHCGSAMGPTFTRKRGKTYRYYLCVHASKNGYAACPVRTVAGGEIEKAVLGQLRAVFRTPEVIARTFREAKTLEAEEIERLRGKKADLEDQRLEAGTPPELTEVKERLDAVTSELRALETRALTESEVIDALERLDPVWEELFPAEQTRIVQLLLERVDVKPDGIELRLRSDGLHSLVAEIGGKNGSQSGAQAG